MPSQAPDGYPTPRGSFVLETAARRSPILAGEGCTMVGSLVLLLIAAAIGLVAGLAVRSLIE